MCFFPFANTIHESEAYKKGVTHFDCGCCPECLAKRARLWALRCSAEAQNNIGCMITLTYDSYKKDRNGRIIGENPPQDLHVNKRDCQLFIKRLRKHFKGVKIKYLLTAEYGKRTHRAHYHAILFGVDFVDKVKYKRSDRGNWIYKSKTLTGIWGNGICTIDAVNVSAQVARYCTKYCAKDSRCDDTFMLVSRGIGDKWLMDNFNGISYMLDGREYSIPKLIWQKKIEFFYRNNYVYNLRSCTYKYRSLAYYLKQADKFYQQFVDNIKDVDLIDPIKWRLTYEHQAYRLADLNAKQRKYFRSFRDCNKLYQKYLEYWNKKAVEYERKQPTVFQRILNLPNDKYFKYKQSALKVLNERKAYIDIDNASNAILPPRYISKHRSFKFLFDKYRICPLPLVIKGQMTPTKYHKMIFGDLCRVSSINFFKYRMKNANNFVKLGPTDPHF